MRVICGDAVEELRKLAAGSVHCCVTSPPYWGLRDYGVKGQIGLEKTPEEYVAKMVEIFREVRRVLRDDGTLWLNLGDSYAAGGSGQNFFDPNGQRPGGGRLSDIGGFGHVKTARNPREIGLKPKDLVGIPWRVAFALQADGWWLRSDIIWHKPNPMPESVTDRPTKAHEYLFLLSKSERYHYDAEAIKEPAICGDPRKPYAPGQVDARGNGHDRNGGKVRASVKRGGFSGKTEAMAEEGRNSFRAVEDWRNKRSVWTIATDPYPEAHFATFPPSLIEPCIKAGCPAGGTVLDPFAGSGTTLEVARRLGCDGIGIELNPEYCNLIDKRLAQEFLELAEVVV
jgi:DNA modification methylase